MKTALLIFAAPLVLGLVDRHIYPPPPPAVAPYVAPTTEERCRAWLSRPPNAISVGIRDRGPCP